MGAAVISITDQFRLRDFNRRLRCPGRLSNSFVGFFGSLEEVNRYLRSRRNTGLRRTPFHVR